MLSPKYDQPQKFKNLIKLISENNCEIIFADYVKYQNFTSAVIRGKKISRRVLYNIYDGLLDQLGHSQIIPYIREINSFVKHLNILVLKKTQIWLQK